MSSVVRPAAPCPMTSSVGAISADAPRGAPPCRGRGAARSRRRRERLGLFAPATAFRFGEMRPRSLFHQPTVAVDHLPEESFSVLSLLGVLGITVVLFLAIAITASLIFGR